MIVITDKKDYALVEPKFKANINSYIDFARQNVPYYRKTISSLADFDKYYEIPLIAEDNLSSDPLSFVAFRDRVVRATTSGGTSGKRKILFRTKEDLKRSIDVVTRLFRGLGVKKGDRIAILQPFDMWNTGHHAMAAFQRIGALSFPVGLSGTDEYVLWLIEKFCCNIVFSTPSRASLLASLGNKIKSIEKVICTSEPILEAHRNAVRKGWGAEIFGTYGTEEFDGIAYECEAHQGYHIVDDDLIIEILDPNLLMPTGVKIGLLVLSKINRTGTVLLRYPVGDIVEIDETTCKCGCKSPRLKFLGRTSESIYLYNGLKITLQSIEEAIRSVLGFLPLYQIVVKGEGGKESLTLMIQQSRSEELGSRILRALLSSVPDMEDAYALDKSLDLRIVMEESLSSFFITRRGKMPRVIDRRQQCQ
ncbi:MAG: hypothetical protein N3D12_05780 [Candidatus Methanomethyliaceae archaeon]|nr:hypothetical protein [Candidatus Methanomethyliaceae archaeon]